MAATMEDQISIDLDQLFSSADALQRGSFDRIYHHYKPALVNFARSEGAQDPEGAADLALFDAFRALDRMRNPAEGAFRSYVYRAARSHIAAEHRGSTLQTTSLDAGADLAAPEIADQVDRLWLESLMDGLTSDQRRVIECRFVAGLSANATAELLDKTPNAIDQLQHRAIRRLRRLAFGGAIVALLVAGILVLQQLSNGSGTIDRQPVEDPVPSVTEQQETETKDADDPVVVDAGSSPASPMSRTGTTEPQAITSTTAAAETTDAVPAVDLEVPSSKSHTTTPSEQATTTATTITTTVAPASTAASTTTAPGADYSAEVPVATTSLGEKADQKLSRIEDKEERSAQKGPEKAAGKADKKSSRVVEQAERKNNKAAKAKKNK